MGIVAGQRTSERALERAAHPRLTLSWMLPPGTGGTRGPDKPTLEISIEGETCSAALIAGGRRVPLVRPAPATLVFEPENNLWHADAPGVIAATWRETADGTIQVLFARTPLIQQLGIPGGTYEFRAARPRAAATISSPRTSR
jgi:hypothetical protein